MLSLILDLVGAYLLVKWLRRLIVIVPLAIVLGIVNSFVANIAMHFLFPESVSENEAVFRAAAGVLWHPLVCLACVWWFRRESKKTATADIDKLKTDSDQSVQKQAESSKQKS